MTDGHRIPQDLNDWMRGIERRVGYVERRPAVASREQILGPGIAPVSAQVIDWNAGNSLLNGWYWSQAPAANSPTPNHDYIGSCMVRSLPGDTIQGVQKLTRMDSPDIEWSRVFTSASFDTAASFGPWVNGDTGWIEPTPLAPWANLGGNEPYGYRRKDGVVYHRGIITGGIANQAWVFLPDGFRPKTTSAQVQQSVNASGTLQAIYIRGSDGAMYFPAYAVGAGYAFMNDIRPYPADE